MRRPSPPGRMWQDATREFAVNVPPEMHGRYGMALDLLAKKVARHVWDCNGGIFETRGKSEARHRLSLARLGCLLVDECEKARNSPRKGTPSMMGKRLTAAERRKLAKDVRSVALSLNTGSQEFFHAILAASKHIVPSPDSNDGIALGSFSAEIRAWLKCTRRLTASTLSAALLAIADVLDHQDHRRKPRHRREGCETTLAAELVTWLRVATGAPWSYQEGDRIPQGGCPCYEVAACFLQAAGWSRMTAPIIKSRLEARHRA